MKKLLSLLLVAGATASLTACGGLPDCTESLDECDRGGPYTEERTVEAGRYKTVVNTPAPAPEPVKVVAPEPVKVMPAPTPAPVVDTQVMRSAEPEFKQISK